MYTAPMEDVSATRPTLASFILATTEFVDASGEPLLELPRHLQVKQAGELYLRQTFCKSIALDLADQRTRGPPQ